MNFKNSIAFILYYSLAWQATEPQWALIYQIILSPMPFRTHFVMSGKAGNPVRSGNTRLLMEQRGKKSHLLFDLSRNRSC